MWCQQQPTSSHHTAHSHSNCSHNSRIQLSSENIDDSETTSDSKLPDERGRSHKPWISIWDKHCRDTTDTTDNHCRGEGPTTSGALEERPDDEVTGELHGSVYDKTPVIIDWKVRDVQGFANTLYRIQKRDVSEKRLVVTGKASPVKNLRIMNDSISLANEFAVPQTTKTMRITKNERRLPNLSAMYPKRQFPIKLPT
ncbi:hypothetical protein GCK72_000711 [Caenorhabditis remanei]|uniref:Uncharacterized protein n=1 Tax=Caenorhabditis remanei TaxID=31234 RepID=A0A6A5HLW6_CAERE|nr:hypothetical protein GCK72_000711 [Caenorhabditis remanei]KAF1768898.1 hypothetical protein GCK72_000711 [Caenorhabditis remanei]